jgi:RimJ/RimL family protein N-acetyltransferase
VNDMGRALETERLVLRRLRLDDAADLHRCTGDPRVMRYWHPGADSDLATTAARIIELGAHWDAHGFGDLGVWTRDSGELVGFAGLHHISGMAEVNIGYALVPARWRCGLGGELCAALLEDGFTVLTLPEIVAVVDRRNVASIALAERSGLSFRGETTWQGQPRLVYALTRAEFEALAGPVSVSLRPVEAADQAAIRRWANAVAGGMSRTSPCAAAADRHDPDAGLFWYVIVEGRRDVGTVWIELPPAGSEAVLGVFLGDPSDCGRGVGTVAVGLAVAEFRRAHPDLRIVLRVRRSNTRAIACYRRVGFTVVSSGSKSSASGEIVPYYRMALTG